MNHFFKVEKTRCTIWCTLYYTSQIGHFYAFWISFVLRLLCQSSCSRNRGLSVFKLFFPLHMSLSVSNLQFCALVSFHTSQRCPSVSFCFVIFFYPPPPHCCPLWNITHTQCLVITLNYGVCKLLHLTVAAMRSGLSDSQDSNCNTAPWWKQPVVLV